MTDYVNLELIINNIPWKVAIIIGIDNKKYFIIDTNSKTLYIHNIPIVEAKHATWQLLSEEYTEHYIG